MALQDLTPQLRTRLTKMERSVGWFVFFATVLILVAFGYYLYHTAQSKGWFNESARFFTYADTAANINVGDPVHLMGFTIGEITGITPMPPRDAHNVRIDFVIDKMNLMVTPPVPYFSYVWNHGSKVKLSGASFLGDHGLEITRSTDGHSVYITRPVEMLTLAEARAKTDLKNWRLAGDLYDADSNIVVKAFTSFTNLDHIAEFDPSNIPAMHITSHRTTHIAAVWDESVHHYVIFNNNPTNAYYLPAADSPAIGDELQAIVAQVKQALPNLLALTNKLGKVLDNAANATSNLNITIAGTQPLVKNITLLTGDLRGPGALGTWVMGSNSAFQLESALTNANTLLVSVNTNLDTLTEQVGLTLINVAEITSNLDLQVQENSNMLWAISKTVVDSDDFIQGLKHHWLLRSAFKKKATDHPPVQYAPLPKEK